MEVSREFALEELDTLIRHLQSWADLIRDPEIASSQGLVPAYPGGIPEGLSVSQLKGVPIMQLKSELSAISGRLEVLVSS